MGSAETYQRLNEFLFDNPGDMYENASANGKHPLALKSSCGTPLRINFDCLWPWRLKKGGRSVERRKALTSLGVGVELEWEVGWGNPTPHGLG
jgi:hypothetical protein